MASHAIIHGLNYEHTSNAQLNGCDTDAERLSELISPYVDTKEVHTLYKRNRGSEILRRINQAARWTHKENVEMVFISFSGHGVRFRQPDDDDDEPIEGICPSDFKKKGVITDEQLRDALCAFHHSTTVYLVIDCCHSGDILNLRYRWDARNHRMTTHEDEEQPDALCIALSGCKQNQTSADAYNVLGKGQYGGALTSCLVEFLQENKRPSVFHMLSNVQQTLEKKRFEQVPVLSSNERLSDHQFLA